ncbi:MAG: hypothetical protein C5B45_03135 [Chlamydiae bacterium]|nr:MAG: hypothetical protein C5B45_03135 [Chlamydiota bacterium]
MGLLLYVKKLKNNFTNNVIFRHYLNEYELSFNTIYQNESVIKDHALEHNFFITPSLLVNIRA